MSLRYPIPATFVGLANYPLGAVLAPVTLGSLFGLVTKRSVSTWYPTLKKPKLNPPKWAFPVAWTYLYGSMGYASHLIASVLETTPFVAEADQASLALTLYYANLGLNFLWTPLFFGLQQPALALVDIVALTGTVFHMTNVTRKIHTKAAYLFLPYCAWLTYATYLNAGVWYLNGGAETLAKVKRATLSLCARSDSSRPADPKND